ncbi:DUF3293 domain-containing protein [Thioalkalivibrio sp. ALJ16]|uniref:DUF3293 domain-containing protein n=1 Tax=Thioalkalivibrio sp. ALJ16 TaxID=1158762 RepID=UPI000570AB60|nr:DUF3293 domain-containing protein [Thioalkalivibrio sp. ALJ16]
MAANTSYDAPVAPRRTPALERAYRAADYELVTPAGRHVLRIDQPAPAVAAWMREHNLRRLVLFTACNPGSQPGGAVANADRQRQLEVAVRDHGLAAWPASNRDPRGHWPDEPGLAIAELPDALLAAWLARFGQNAALLLEPPAPPRLVWHPALRRR